MDAKRRHHGETPILASISVREVLDSAPDLIFACDAGGSFLWLNTAVETLTGRPRQELIGEPFTARVPQRGRRRLLARLARAWRDGGEVASVETPVDTAAGPARLTARIRRLVQPDGDTLFVGVARASGTAATDADLGEKLEQLTAALEETRAVAAMKAEALATMAHEIRSPMNGMLGLLQVLLESDLDRDQRGIVEILQNSARGLLALVNDTVEFSRLETGTLEIHPVDFDVVNAANDVAALLGPFANEKRLHFECRIGSQVPRLLRGDPGRIRQVLLNLANNAIKFTEKGSVRIQIDVVDEREDRVELWFAVTDSGIGIAPETVARLFRPFDSKGPSIAARFAGTGLGLSISRRLVAMMGGEMGVDSEPGQGSTFWFRLKLPRGTETTAPAPAAGTTAAAAPSPPAEPAGPRGRVLIVEDGRVNQLVAAWCLQKLGHRVETALTAADALARCEREPYDLVLLDLRLPDGDGYEVARELRRREAAGARRVGIVAMTGVTDADAREKCLAAGMDDFLAKPVDLDRLTHCVSRWTGSAAGAEAAATREAPGPPTAGAEPPAPPAAAVDPVPTADLPPTVDRAPAVDPAPAIDPARVAVAPAAAETPEPPRPALASVVSLEPRRPPVVTPVDLDQLETMCMGIPKLRDTLLGTFAAEIGPRIERLAAVVAAGDARACEFEAHGLKSMSGTIGAHRAQQLFETIEHLARAGDLATTEALVTQARLEATRVLEFIRTLPLSEAA